MPYSGALPTELVPSSPPPPNLALFGLETPGLQPSLALGRPGLHLWSGHLWELFPLETTPVNVLHAISQPGFNAQTFPHHAYSLGPSPLHLLF
jgi:hypothetical protein